MEGGGRHHGTYFCGSHTARCWYAVGVLSIFEATCWDQTGVELTPGMRRVGGSSSKAFITAPEAGSSKRAASLR